MGHDTASAAGAAAYPPWPDAFPEGLAGWGQAALLRPLGLGLDTYGTVRMLGRRADGPRDIVAAVDIPRAAPGSAIQIEVLPPATAEGFADAGLCLAGADVAGSKGVLDTLRAATGRHLVLMPGIAASVASLVRCLHVVVVEDDDYDRSHSEPDLPFSIFVSVPDARRADAALRVAESIVHEAMHLQLTLFERRVPLVDPKAAVQFYSPWRGTNREASGVLHALYVFRVIERFWQSVAAHDEAPSAVHFARKRREQIEAEIAEIEDFRHCAALTPAGKSLVAMLIAGSRDR